ncbi:MAG TPA: tetratricopeptide repeat protein, partial [Kofleriaceae bacterium]|nr:tetratricopeptide repeat protein [Kofleriaceae bacterium]
VAAALAALALATAPTAAAGPAGGEVRDYDQDEEERSDFWERALEPDRGKYEDLIERAVTLLREKDAESRKLGAAILRDAVRLAPDLPDAHMLLGRLAAEEGDHAACARSIARALEADPDHRPASADVPVEWAAGYELAVCRARAGDLEAGIDGLRRILERGYTGSSLRHVHQRLGECYMALGRLDEAREALEQAYRLAHGDPDIAFALAVVHDRGEESARARDLMTRALERDPGAHKLQESQRVWIPAADVHYHQGLAFLHAGQHGRALYHFRRYLAEAGKSPWLARARKHLAAAEARAIAGSDLAVKGSASMDEARAAAAIGKIDRELQACLAGTPDLLLRVTITRVVPAGRTDGGTRSRARAGVRVVVVEQEDVPGDALRAAIACAEKAAGGAALPRPTGGPGSYATADFTIVSRGR